MPHESPGSCRQSLYLIYCFLSLLLSFSEVSSRPNPTIKLPFRLPGFLSTALTPVTPATSISNGPLQPSQQTVNSGLDFGRIHRRIQLPHMYKLAADTNHNYGQPFTSPNQQRIQYQTAQSSNQQPFFLAVSHPLYPVHQLPIQPPTSNSQYSRQNQFINGVPQGNIVHQQPIIQETTTKNSLEIAKQRLKEDVLGIHDQTKSIEIKSLLDQQQQQQQKISENQQQFKIPMISESSKRYEQSQFPGDLFYQNKKYLPSDFHMIELSKSEELPQPKVKQFLKSLFPSLSGLDQKQSSSSQQDRRKIIQTSVTPPVNSRIQHFEYPKLEHFEQTPPVQLHMSLQPKLQQFPPFENPNLTHKRQTLQQPPQILNTQSPISFFTNLHQLPSNSPFLLAFKQPQSQMVLLGKQNFPVEIHPTMPPAILKPTSPMLPSFIEILNSSTTPVTTTPVALIPEIRKVLLPTSPGNSIESDGSTGSMEERISSFTGSIIQNDSKDSSDLDNAATLQIPQMKLTKQHFQLLAEKFNLHKFFTIHKPIHIVNNIQNKTQVEASAIISTMQPNSTNQKTTETKFLEINSNVPINENYMSNILRAAKLNDSTTKNSMSNFLRAAKLNDSTTKNSMSNFLRAAKLNDSTTKNSMSNFLRAAKLNDSTTKNSMSDFLRASKLNDSTTKNSMSNLSIEKNSNGNIVDNPMNKFLESYSSDSTTTRTFQINLSTGINSNGNIFDNPRNKSLKVYSNDLTTKKPINQPTRSISNIPIIKNNRNQFGGIIFNNSTSKNPVDISTSESSIVNIITSTTPKNKFLEISSTVSTTTTATVKNKSSGVSLSTSTIENQENKTSGVSSSDDIIGSSINKPIGMNLNALIIENPKAKSLEENSGADAPVIENIWNKPMRINSSIFDSIKISNSTIDKLLKDFETIIAFRSRLNSLPLGIDTSLASGSEINSRPPIPTQEDIYAKDDEDDDDDIETSNSVQLNATVSNKNDDDDDAVQTVNGKRNKDNNLFNLPPLVSTSLPQLEMTTINSIVISTTPIVIESSITTTEASINTKAIGTSKSEVISSISPELIQTASSTQVTLQAIKPETMKPDYTSGTTLTLFLGDTTNTVDPMVGDIQTIRPEIIPKTTSMSIPRTLNPIIEPTLPQETEIISLEMKPSSIPTLPFETTTEKLKPVPETQKVKVEAASSSIPSTLHESEDIKIRTLLFPKSPTNNMKTIGTDNPTTLLSEVVTTETYSVKRPDPRTMEVETISKSIPILFPETSTRTTPETMLLETRTIDAEIMSSSSPGLFIETVNSSTLPAVLSKMDFVTTEASSSTTQELLPESATNISFRPTPTSSLEVKSMTNINSDGISTAFSNTTPLKPDSSPKTTFASSANRGVEVIQELLKEFMSKSTGSPWIPDDKPTTTYQVLSSSPPSAFLGRGAVLIQNLISELMAKSTTAELPETTTALPSTTHSVYQGRGQKLIQKLLSEMMASSTAAIFPDKNIYAPDFIHSTEIVSRPVNFATLLGTKPVQSYSTINPMLPTISNIPISTLRPTESNISLSNAHTEKKNLIQNINRSIMSSSSEDANSFEILDMLPIYSAPSGASIVNEQANLPEPQNIKVDSSTSALDELFPEFGKKEKKVSPTSILSIGSVTNKTKEISRNALPSLNKIKNLLPSRSSTEYKLPMLLKKITGLKTKEILNINRNFSTTYKSKTTIRDSISTTTRLPTKPFRPANSVEEMKMRMKNVIARARTRTTTTPKPIITTSRSGTTKMKLFRNIPTKPSLIVESTLVPARSRTKTVESYVTPSTTKIYVTPTTTKIYTTSKTGKIYNAMFKSPTALSSISTVRKRTTPNPELSVELYDAASENDFSDLPPLPAQLDSEIPLQQSDITFPKFSENPSYLTTSNPSNFLTGSNKNKKIPNEMLTAKNNSQIIKPTILDKLLEKSTINETIANQNDDLIKLLMASNFSREYSSFDSSNDLPLPTEVLQGKHSSTDYLLDYEENISQSDPKSNLNLSTPKTIPKSIFMSRSTVPPFSTMSDMLDGYDDLPPIPGSSEYDSSVPILSKDFGRPPPPGLPVEPEYDGGQDYSSGQDSNESILPVAATSQMPLIIPTSQTTPSYIITTTPKPKGTSLAPLGPDLPSSNSAVTLTTTTSLPPTTQPISMYTVKRVLKQMSVVHKSAPRYSSMTMEVVKPVKPTPEPYSSSNEEWIREVALKALDRGISIQQVFSINIGKLLLHRTSSGSPDTEETTYWTPTGENDNEVVLPPTEAFFLSPTLSSPPILNNNSILVTDEINNTSLIIENTTNTIKVTDSSFNTNIPIELTPDYPPPPAIFKLIEQTSTKQQLLSKDQSSISLPSPIFPEEEEEDAQRYRETRNSARFVKRIRIRRPKSRRL